MVALYKAKPATFHICILVVPIYTTIIYMQITNQNIYKTMSLSKYIYIYADNFKGLCSNKSKIKVLFQTNLNRCRRTNTIGVLYSHNLTDYFLLYEM